MYQSGKGYKAISKDLYYIVIYVIHKRRKLVTVVNFFCDMTLNSPFMLKNSPMCKEEYNIPPQRCERLIASYHECLISVVAAKGGIRFGGQLLCPCSAR